MSLRGDCRQRKIHKMTTSKKKTKNAVTPTTKAPVAKGRAKAAPLKAQPATKAANANNPATAPRAGSKTETILDLLKRPGGATAKELLKATSWQPHSLRGFVSGTLGKKMGLTVISAKGEDGERSYSVKA